MQFRRKVVGKVLPAVALPWLLQISAIADAGRFAGSSNYGGGSSHSSGGINGGLFVIGLFRGDAGDWIALLFTLAIIVYAGISAKHRGKTNKASQIEARPVYRPMQALLDKDPSFSEAAFRSKISSLYVQLQNAWEKKDLSPMRPFMSDALYTQFDRQLDELRKSDFTNVIDGIEVLDIFLSNCRCDEKEDVVEAIVKTRIVDYVIDDKTGRVLQGSKKAEKYMMYRWTLVRSAVRRKASQAQGVGVDVRRCPSCGAPLEINASARCPYCGSVVMDSDFDWVLTSIEGLVQQSHPW